MVKNKQVVFITGGTSGIGLSIVKKYLFEGFFVVINYKTGGKDLNSVRKDFKDIGYVKDVDYIFLKADIGKEDVFLKAFLRLPHTIRNKITIVINNAGILKRGEITKLKQKDWVDVFNVNVFGIINVSKTIYSNSKKLRSIINIGSIRGEPAVARTNNLIYSVSKSVIPTLTATLAKTFGPKVRVNAILPGTIDTPQRQGMSKNESAFYGESNTILKRLGEPQEIAELCNFITSEKGAYITGSSFVIDGGYTVNYIR